jgi:hypothetical protein
MALTRPTARQINTSVNTVSDPLSVLNKDSTEANIDVGFIFNRDGGISSNVAIFWNETTSQFNLAYTSANGSTNANVVVTAYSDLKANTLYGNIGGGSVLSNVYVTGSLLPSVDVTYDLGSATQRWREGYFSGNTIYIGSESISVDSDGKWSLTSKGNRVEMDADNGFKFGNPNSIQSTVTQAYVDGQITAANAGVTSANIGMKGYVDNAISTIDVSTIYVDGQIAAANAGVISANIGMQGYVDQGNTIQAAAITSANIGMKGYVDGQITSLIGGSPETLDTLNEIAIALGNDANLSVTLTNLITEVQANVTAANLAITSANIGMKGYVDTEIAGIAYSNVQVATYLPTHTGNVGASSVNATNLFGTIRTAAQTSITSVGTLGSLSVTGNITSGNTTVSGGSLGTVLGTTLRTLSLSTTTTNSDSLQFYKIRQTEGGTDWTSAAWRIQQRIDVSDMGYIQFNGTGLQRGISIGTNNTERMRITGITGNVGIGNTNPLHTLSVSGTGNFTGTVTAPTLTVSGAITINSSNAVTAIINGGTNGVGNIGASGQGFNTVFAKSTSAQYADLAEIYTSDRNYVPGTVVVFGGDKEVTVSLTNHDTAVAGVVSTNPAYLMNDSIEGVAVALQGRVPCRVLGPVNKGDRVVSSDVRGVAERLDMAKYQPGCIIGKALDYVPADEIATIEVVVGRN